MFFALEHRSDWAVNFVLRVADVGQDGSINAHEVHEAVGLGAWLVHDDIVTLTNQTLL